MTGTGQEHHHVSPFYVAAPPSVTQTNHAFLSTSGHSDDQPLDLTGGSARKRRGNGSPSPEAAAAAAADPDSPLDLTVKRPRTDDGPTVRFPESERVRGGLAMSGGGVVPPAPIRSIHVARSPVPLSQLHTAAGQRLSYGADIPSLGAVPVIRRVSGTTSQPPQKHVVANAPRLPATSTRHARDIPILVNGHKPEVARPDVHLGTKSASSVSRADVVQPAFVHSDYAAAESRRCSSPGRQSYHAKGFDRGAVPVVVGRSAVESSVSPTPVPASACSAYITPTPPLRPGTVARRLAPRSKAFQTETSSGPSHRVTLVDRLGPAEAYRPLLPTSPFVPPAPSEVASRRGLYFADRPPENSGTSLLRPSFSTPLWHSLAATDDADSAKNADRLPAFGGPCVAENSSSDVDGRSSSGDGASSERNFAVTSSAVDFVERQRAPLNSASSLGGGHPPRRVPVANVHPIMKETAMVAPGGVGPPAFTDDDSCSELPIPPRRPSDATPTAAKDVTALLAAGLSRGGRVSSHHMEYVKFLSQSVDDSASSTPSAPAGGCGPRRGTLRTNQPVVDRRRATPRGGLAYLSAKARRQLYFRRDDDPHQHPAAAVPDRMAESQSGINYRLFSSYGYCYSYLSI